MPFAFQRFLPICILPFIAIWILLQFQFAGNLPVEMQRLSFISKPEASTVMQTQNAPPQASAAVPALPPAAVAAPPPAPAPPLVPPPPIEPPKIVSEKLATHHSGVVTKRPLHNATARLAVVISGLTDRFLITSKLRRIIQPATATGCLVDIYMALVARGHGGATWNKIPNSKTSDLGVNVTTEQVAEHLRNAGGHVAYCNLTAAREDIQFPRNPPLRLKQYSPIETDIGRSVVRKFMTLEFLMTHVRSRERAMGVQYDFVLLTRDDDHWMGPFDLLSFKAENGHENNVYSRNCKTEGGINDKTLLFGRLAAERVLERLYSDFWMRDKRLEAWNAEAFWKAFIHVKGVRSKQVSLSRLPTAASVFVNNSQGNFYLCQKRYKICASLPKRDIFEQPVVCPGS